MARAGGWLGLRLKDATTRLTGRVESSSPLLWLLCVCAGVMSDAGEKDKCADLKLIYSKCFNTWCPPPPSHLCQPLVSARALQVHREISKGRHRCRLPTRVRSVQGAWRAPSPLTIAVRMHE
jgi:hypothetical protein